MQAVALLKVDCFTCLKKLGENNLMQPLGNGTWFCPRCKNVKQLDDRYALHPMTILSMSSLPLLNVAYVTTMYLLNNLPLALQISMGAFLFTGYLAKGLRLLGR